MGPGTRLIADITILILVFIAPWWLTLFLVCAGLFVFENFYESIVFGLLLDGFHGVPGVTMWGINALCTIVISVVFLLSIFLKTRLTFYTD